MKSIAGYTDSSGYRCLENLRKEWVDLNLCYCGCEDCKPDSGFGPSKRNKFLLHVIWRGKGRLEIGGRTYQLERGDAFLISPDVTAFYQADSEHPWSYFWIGFSGLKAKEYIESAGFYEDSPVRKVEDVDKLYRYVDQILTSHDLTPEAELKRMGLLLMFFSSLTEDYSKSHVARKRREVSSRDALYISNTVDYIDKNYDGNLKISELADRIGISRSYLSTCFKRVMGCSPQEYIMNLRMEKGRLLIRTTGLPIGEVADLVGYKDPLAFSRIFKQYFGLSPMAYRSSSEELLICNEKGEFQGAEL